MATAQDKRAEQEYYDQLFRKRKRFDQFPTNELYDDIAAAARRLAQGKQALDLGCGSGTQSLALLAQGFAVVSADLSEEATRVTQSNSRDAGRSLPVLRADAESLPFPDASFDVCVCSMLLHHFKTLDKVAVELQRVVRPGGVVLAFDTNAHNPFVWLFFNVVHALWPLPHLTRNQRALWSGEIERAMGSHGFGAFHFSSRSTVLRRDWLGNSLAGALNFYSRALLLRLSNVLLPSIARGNGLLSIFRRLPASDSAPGGPPQPERPAPTGHA